MCQIKNQYFFQLFQFLISLKDKLLKSYFIQVERFLNRFSVCHCNSYLCYLLSSAILLSWFHFQATKFLLPIIIAKIYYIKGKFFNWKFLAFSERKCPILNTFNDSNGCIFQSEQSLCHIILKLQIAELNVYKMPHIIFNQARNFQIKTSPLQLGADQSNGANSLLLYHIQSI